MNQIELDIDSIEAEGDTQSRVSCNEATIEDYQLAMQEGAIFPPIDVYYDGEKYWLADGFHRLYAAKLARLDTIAANVSEGTRRDAILHSVKANATHGLRRTNADKRRAAEILLKDEEWSQWSDNAIAKQCGVSQPFISKLREEASYNGYKMRRTVTRNGATYLQNTENIGRIKTYANGTTLVDIKSVPVPDSENDDSDALDKSAEEMEQPTPLTTSVNEQITRLGESLGLPTRGNSVLPESDRTDELTHISPVDVDDRLGAFPSGGIAVLQKQNHRLINASTDEIGASTKVIHPNTVITPAQWQAAQFKIEQLESECDELKNQVKSLTKELETFTKYKGFASFPAKKKAGKRS